MPEDRDLQYRAQKKTKPDPMEGWTPTPFQPGQPISQASDEVYDSDEWMQFLEEQQRRKLANAPNRGLRDAATSVALAMMAGPTDIASSVSQGIQDKLVGGVRGVLAGGSEKARQAMDYIDDIYTQTQPGISEEAWLAAREEDDLHRRSAFGDSPVKANPASVWMDASTPEDVVEDALRKDEIGRRLLENIEDEAEEFADQLDRSVDPDGAGFAGPHRRLGQENILTAAADAIGYDSDAAGANIRGMAGYAIEPEFDAANFADQQLTSYEDEYGSLKNWQTGGYDLDYIKQVREALDHMPEADTAQKVHLDRVIRKLERRWPKRVDAIVQGWGDAARAAGREGDEEIRQALDWRYQVPSPGRVLDQEWQYVDSPLLGKETPPPKDRPPRDRGATRDMIEEAYLESGLSPEMARYDDADLDWGDPSNPWELSPYFDDEILESEDPPLFTDEGLYPERGEAPPTHVDYWERPERPKYSYQTHPDMHVYFRDGEMEPTQGSLDAYEGEIPLRAGEPGAQLPSEAGYGTQGWHEDVGTIRFPTYTDSYATMDDARAQAAAFNEAASSADAYQAARPMDVLDGVDPLDWATRAAALPVAMGLQELSQAQDPIDIVARMADQLSRGPEGPRPLRRADISDALFNKLARDPAGVDRLYQRGAISQELYEALPTLDKGAAFDRATRSR
jgi:hypothetical protein